MNWLHWTRLMLVGLPLAAACAGADPDQGSQTDGEYASARIAIMQAPADVLCISITAQGSRTVQQSFDVMPGQSTVLSMNRLPTGPVTFSGEAFDTSCVSAPGTTPGWIADPVVAQLSSGPPANVVLSMKRNAQANVAVDFEEDCNGGGAACMVNSECCSGFQCIFIPGNPFPTCEPTGCQPDGAMCSAATPCCSGFCNGGICTPPTGCFPDGAMCSTASQCCNGSCVSGVCSGPACSPNGAPCMTAAECCSALCVNGVCNQQQACSPDGAACMTAAECCSMTCNNGVCGQGLCSMPGQLCSMLQPCCPGFVCGTIFGQGVCQ